MLNRRDVLLAGAAVAAVAMVPVTGEARVPEPVLDTTRLIGYHLVFCLEDITKGLIRLDQVEKIYAGDSLMPMHKYEDWAGHIAKVAANLAKKKDGLPLVRRMMDTLHADGRLREWAEMKQQMPSIAWWGQRMNHEWAMPVRADPFESDVALRPFRWG